MPMTRAQLDSALGMPAYPRSGRYDPVWVLENLMGPNVLWLAEALTSAMDLRAGMRVLDMGCGKAVSSVFLAREFGVQVFALDLWVSASGNWERIRGAGLDGQIVPIHAEAHQLPFADGFFDAAISLDAYHYFGTDDLYADYFARFLRPQAQVGIVSPGLRQEFGREGPPSHLRPYWQSEFFTFHSPAWWRSHWERSHSLIVERADLVEDGAALWLKWLEVSGRAGYPTSADEAAMLRQDGGAALGFTRVVGRRRDDSAPPAATEPGAGG